MELIVNSFNFLNDEEDENVNKTHEIWPIVELDRQIILDLKKPISTSSLLIELATYDQYLNDEKISFEIKLQIIKGRFIDPKVSNKLLWKSIPGHVIDLYSLEYLNPSAIITDIFFNNVIIPYLLAINKKIHAQKGTNLYISEMTYKNLVVYSSDPQNFEEQKISKTIY